MSQSSLGQVGPTLFIGLGGAGGHVVGRLNRLMDETFADEYERLGDARPIQFLLLDTDDFEKLDSDVRDSLDKPQQSFVSLSHFNPRRYAEKQLEIHDTDLKRWFDRAALPYLEDVTIHDGASRLRMLGRLGLHRHYDVVERQIRAKVDAALDAGVHKESTRLRPDPPPLRIYLVASSCGGTGSAIFLDVAFLVNRIVRDRGWSPEVTGFVFLPSPYIEANAKMDPALEAFYQHNAWAFFEELNYFLARPERIPEYALDPDRRYGELPRPLDQYGRDLLRTVYLIGNNIPPVGMLPLGRPLYEYTAQGIFHTFLTPEEGAIQSHYSNIKSKLKDRDRKFDLVKRFAAFGYAEYRSSGADYSDKLVATLVHDHWQQLSGGRLDEEGARAEARKLERVLDDGLNRYDRDAGEWRANLGLGDLHDGGPLPSATEIHQSRDDADQSCRKTKQEIVEVARRDLTEALRKALGERLLDPPHGVAGELDALEAFRDIVERRARSLMDTPEKPPIGASDAINDRLSELAGEIPKEGRWFGKRAFEAAREAFNTRARNVENDIQKIGREWLKAEVRRELGTVLSDDIVPFLKSRIEALERITRALADHAPSRPDAPNPFAVPTIREVPPLRMLVEERIEADAAKAREDHATTVRADLREAWAEAVHELARGDDAAAERLRERIADTWSAQITRESDHVDIEAAVRDWVKREHGPEIERAPTPEMDRGNARGAPASREMILAQLEALSTPACPLDRSTVDRSDSVPKIFAVVGPFNDASHAKAQLSLRDTCSHIGGHTKDRIAVLQTWYAFSSRALDGMETLRRSYLRRDRRQSLPHIDKLWNEEGLFQSEGTDDLNERDEELVARLLALSLALSEGQGETAFGERMRLHFDQPDGERPFLLAYRDSGYGHTFHWRDARRVPGYAATWKVLAPATSARNGRPDGAAPAGELIAELHDYLASEVRERHDEILAALAEIEPTEAGEPIVRAYRGYLERLETMIVDEERRGHVRYLGLLYRLRDRLETYLTRFEREEPLKL